MWPRRPLTVLGALAVLGAAPGTPREAEVGRVIGAGPAVEPELGAPGADRWVFSELERSPPVPGLGPRLAAALRRGGPDQRLRFVARGLGPAELSDEGASVTAQLGPIISGTSVGHALLRLAPRALLIERPQPLRAMLDVSRTAIGVTELDRGHDLPERFRGRGALVALYDSGVDLAHPDLREVGGATRVVALWDQSRAGTPPPGQLEGHGCTRTELAEDRCDSGDPTAHGTHVAAIAVSNAPRYRGVAPEAGLVVARSDRYELFLEALLYFHAVSVDRGLPLVVNLSLGGHEGPHDGTSLESQAIDAYPHLVVAAAGNEGTAPIHARADVREGSSRDVVLRFPTYDVSTPQVAIAEVWGAPDQPLAVSVALVEADGTTLAETATVGTGSPGLTERLLLGPVPAGHVLLDAEATPNPFNGRPHVRAEIDVEDWRDPPAGPAFVALRIRGEGAVHVWVDTPAELPLPVTIDRDQVTGSARQVAGDTELTVSDPATAVSAIAVSAYSTRASFPAAGGLATVAGASPGTIARFSAYGPTLDPGATGPKPDLAAPGHVVVAARAASASETDPGRVSELYRAAGGTSMAAPHVAGAAALILGAKPKATKFDLKQYLVGTAAPASDGGDALDPRWGAGRVDVRAAVSAAMGYEVGCACSAGGEGPAAIPGGRRRDEAPWLALVLPILASFALQRARRRSP